MCLPNKLAESSNLAIVNINSDSDAEDLPMLINAGPYIYGAFWSIQHYFVSTFENSVELIIGVVSSFLLSLGLKLNSY